MEPDTKQSPETEPDYRILYARKLPGQDAFRASIGSLEKRELRGRSVAKLYHEKAPNDCGDPRVKRWAKTELWVEALGKARQVKGARG